MEIKGIYLMEKIWFAADGSYEKSGCFAFGTFRAANRAMHDDFILEYDDGRPPYEEVSDGQKHDPYGWQVAPFECDMVSEVKFLDGRKIRWEIFRCNVENEE